MLNYLEHPQASHPGPLQSSPQEHEERFCEVCFLQQELFAVLSLQAAPEQFPPNAYIEPPIAKAATAENKMIFVFMIMFFFVNFLIVFGGYGVGNSPIVFFIVLPHTAKHFRK